MSRFFLYVYRLWKSEKSKAVFRFVFPISIFVFIAYFFFSSWNVVISLLKNVDSQRLALCVLGWSSLHLISPLFSYRILKGFGSGARLVDVYTTYWNRLPAKYLPGGVWQTVARVSDLKLRGLSAESLRSLMFYEVAIPPLFTATMGGILICASSKNIVIARYGEIIALVVGPILLAFPYFSFYLSFKKISTISLPCYLQSIIVLIVFWSGAGFAFFLYLSAFNIHSHVAQIVGAYMAAWTIGYITIFAPQGMGVAEVSLAQLLDLPTTFSASVTILAGFRVVILCADLLVWLGYRGFTSCYHLFGVRD